MSIKYIEPFVTATQTVFRDFFGEEAVPRKPFLIKRDEPRNWVLSGIIGIGGDSKGVVVVSHADASTEQLPKAPRVKLSVVAPLTATDWETGARHTPSAWTV